MLLFVLFMIGLTLGFVLGIIFRHRQTKGILYCQRFDNSDRMTLFLEIEDQKEIVKSDCIELKVCQLHSQDIPKER